MFFSSWVLCFCILTVYSFIAVSWGCRVLFGLLWLQSSNFGLVPGGPRAIPLFCRQDYFGYVLWHLWICYCSSVKGWGILDWLLLVWLSVILDPFFLFSECGVGGVAVEVHDRSHAPVFSSGTLMCVDSERIRPQCAYSSGTIFML